MSPAAMLIAGVFSFCTPDYCAMGPPLRVWPAPINRQPVAPVRVPYMTQDQQREYIIRQGEAFCRRYPTDKICHQMEPK